jgi:hypothetical protein
MVWAGVYGDSNESGHLPQILKKVKITADTGYHGEQYELFLQPSWVGPAGADFRKRGYSNVGMLDSSF